MTLVVAANGEDFIVLCSDSRGTKVDNAGNRTQVNNVVKLYKITERTGILLFGTTDQAVYLLQKFQKAITNKQEGVTKIAEKFSKFCFKEYEKFYNLSGFEVPFFGFIIAGLDKEGSKFIPKSYNFGSYNAFLMGASPLNYTTNGKNNIADYLLIKHYQDNMNLDDLCGLIGYVFQETKEIDGDVGGDLQMAIINVIGFRKTKTQDIEKFVTGFESDLEK